MSAPGGGGGEQDATEKPHEPTPKKLEEARRKGEVPRSADMGTAAGYAALVLVAAAVGASSLEALGARLAGMLARADTLAPALLSGGGRLPAGGLMGGLSLSLAPWFAAPMAAVLLAYAAQRALIFTPSKLEMKVSRISPIATAKSKFGRAGLFEFAKSTVKLAVYTLVLALYLSGRVERLIGTMHLAPAMAAAEMGRLALEFLAVATLIAAAIAAVDYLWQVVEHRRRNRMSHQDLKDEIKQSEGDPMLKQQRRQRGMEIATNRMLADVPGASVVVVNPSHYAVALQWQPGGPRAPVCVAKGVDEVAARIREAAAAAGVPIHRDAPTARALHATVAIGQEIPRAQYRAVAAAIRFAEEMRQRARARG